MLSPGEPPAASSLTPPPPPPPPIEPLPARPSRTKALLRPSAAERPYAPLRRVVAEVPNRTSLFGGPTLGAWNRGGSFLLGFPVLSVRAALGLTDRFDVGVGFDSMYLLMNEPRLTARYGGWTNGEWTLAATLEAGWAFFQQKSAREVNGSRWMTGRRNANVSPGFQLSYQAHHPRAARFVVDASYLAAVDLEPYTSQPLGGVPPLVVVGHNLMLRLGAELPLSEKASFVFLLGFDIHGRDVDSSVMPSASVGVVTGL